MNYKENELLKLTREYKAAEELANAHNCLASAMRNSHRA